MAMPSPIRDTLSVDEKASSESNVPMPISLIAFGKAIRTRRLELELSQESLAERCGFDRTYISMLERGTRNPSLLNLVKLARGLGTSVSQLTEVFDGTRSRR